MAISKSKAKGKEQIETKPDGWDRFTKAVKRMAPSKPSKVRPAKRLKPSKGK